MIETLAESFETCEGIAPTCVQSDAASMSIPQARLLSNRAGHSSRDKAHFCDGDHGANATIALRSWSIVEGGDRYDDELPRTPQWLGPA